MVPKRNTIQRALVLDAVRELKNHATAEEVYRVVVRRCPTISRTTVYRDLNQLSESGEIRKMETSCGADRYDHIPADHYHVRCTVCGRVFDIGMDYMADLTERIRDDRGFIISGHDLIFRGICPECAGQQSGRDEEE